jgi:octaprenyl-diphosphate synthase
LSSFGRNLGIAFQMIDDVLDYSAKQATLGKTVGDDLREGKVTLPVLLSYRRGNEEERIFWKRVIEDLDQNDDDLRQAIAYMTKHNSLVDTVTRARHYGDMAKDALAIFPDNTARKALTDVVDFCIERAY